MTIGLAMCVGVGVGVGTWVWVWVWVWKAAGGEKKRETPEGTTDRTDKGEQSDRGHTTRHSHSQKMHFACIYMFFAYKTFKIKVN
jgi:hypothetical protein